MTRADDNPEQPAQDSQRAPSARSSPPPPTRFTQLSLIDRNRRPARCANRVAADHDPGTVAQPAVRTSAHLRLAAIVCSRAHARARVLH
jgi:hypothetical protein